MPLQATSGAASYDAFGGGVAVVPTYIEDVFSTYLYTGTGASQTITNGIDLSGKGGAVWIKSRSNATSNVIFDTVRGIYKFVATDTTNSQDTINDTLTAFNSTGFTLGSDALDGKVNTSPRTYVSWTFRKQPKFFDVVTYTGTGVARTVAHNLGSVPGCIIVKRTDTAGFDWLVYHRSTGNTNRLLLNDTVPAASGTSFWNDTTPTSTVFTVGTNVNGNASGGTYIAYIFAHDAGGFGLTGTDNVISCGSFNYNTFPQTVELGYEPQWLMVKQTDGVGDWIMFDNMRGFTANSGGGAGKRLLANTSGAETANDGLYYGSATGFNLNLPAAGNYIYITIRRGPMKVPTSGTSVFQPVTYSGNNSNDRLVDTTITPDLFIDMRRDNVMNKYVLDRLRGNGQLYSDLTNAESANTAQVPANTFNVNQTGVTVSADELNTSGRTYVLEAFRRAPSFFDEVCYTGTGSATTFTHNLGVAPEMMIVKSRSAATEAEVYVAPLGNDSALNLFAAGPAAGAAFTTSGIAWNNTTPTASVFSLGNWTKVNGSGVTFVAYLFATCAGVSKVGSYTGTGTTQIINCGFTTGSRFVLIKRTDSTGDWYVWDSARGIVPGNDPYLLLNSTAAEDTSTDYIDTYSAGFEISSTAPAAINANGGTFIFLAIA